MRMFVTGDVHGNIDFKKLTIPFKYKKFLNVDIRDIDIMFIAGDAGFIWGNSAVDDAIKKKIEKLPYTILAVLGNHENYDLIEQIPIETWNGIKVRRVTNNCFYLVSPQVFELDGKKFFIMQGATSLDKKWREPGVSWWAQELPNQKEVDYARRLLEENDNKIDYIITHCGSAKLIYNLFGQNALENKDILNDFFDEVDNVVTYKKWFMGHYHLDKDISDRNGNKVILYDMIEEIK